jgi:hypothetical protein
MSDSPAEKHVPIERLSVSEAAQSVITLVHGTRVFLTRPPQWINENSPLCQCLKAKVPNCVIQQFPWPGSNSMRSRIRAAVDLRQFLRASRSRYPSAQHFVIAHSHGGNVALHAICGTELEASIQGIICLATPFLHVRRNRGIDPGQTAAAVMYWMMPALGGMAFISLASLLAMVILGVCKARDVQCEPGWLGSFGLGYLILVLGLKVGGVLAEMKGSFTEKLSRAVDRICEENCGPETIGTKLLILRTAADEASGLLVAGQFSTWLIRTLSRLFEAPRQLTGRLIKALEEDPLSWRVGRFGAIAILLSSILVPIPGLILFGVPWYWMLVSALWPIPVFVDRQRWRCVWAIAVVLPILASIVGGILLRDWFWMLVTPFLWMSALVETVILGVWLLRIALTVVVALVGIPLSLVSIAFLYPFGRELVWSTPWLDVSAEPTPPGHWSVCLLSAEDSPSSLRHNIYEDPRALHRIAEWLRTSSILSPL